MHYFEVGSHYLIAKPSLPQNNVGIVGLLWINQHQHCDGGGEGEVDRKTISWQKCPKTFDQDCLNELFSLIKMVALYTVKHKNNTFHG